MRKGIAETRTPHITTGNVFDDLGLTPSEALEAKIKSEMWTPIIARIESLGYTQSEIAARLKIHQPDVSNLLNGKISKFSVGKLIQFAARLNLHAEMKVTASQETRKPRPATRHRAVSRAQA